MRFDARRAVETAESFASDRLPWTEGGRRAADRVAEAFEKAGWTTERVEVSGSPAARNRRLALGWLILGSTVFVNLVVLAAGHPLFNRLLILAWVLIAWYLGIKMFARRGWLFGRSVRTSNVIANRAVATDRPVRVIFATSLDVSPPMPRSPVRQWSGVIIMLLLFVTILLNVPRVRPPRAGALAVLAAFGLAFVTHLVARIRPFPGERGDDNRDGLGFLVEYARAWQAGIDSRYEVYLAALGGQTLDLVGMRTLFTEIQNEWPPKPTLIVGVWSPGRSTTLTLVSRDLTELATEAASSLWIPHRVDASLDAMTDLFFYSQVPGVALLGIIGVPTGKFVEPVDPDALGRAAQLAQEVAARWAREAAKAQAEGFAPSRSPQNPG